MNAAESLMREEAAKALEAKGRGDIAAWLLHSGNARKLAQGLGLSARENKEEKSNG